MIPTLLFLGLVAGLLVTSLRGCAAAVLTLSIAWGALVALGDTQGSFVVATAVGVANALAGCAVGTFARLLFVESRRVSPS